MTALSAAHIQKALQDMQDPHTGGPLGVGGVQVAGGQVRVVIGMPSPHVHKIYEPLRQEVVRRLLALDGVEDVQAILTAERPPQASTPNHAPTAPRRAPPVEKIAVPARHIIAVASGKGGVGKSTTAVNLAVALAAQGLQVGLLDADIYGPSLPTMLGISERAGVEDKRLQPLTKHGLQVMSLGFLQDVEAPVIWRGPMVMGAIQQMLGDTDWQEMDVLVIDLPPGTGDAQLTLAQRVKLAGAVIVSTPQDVALIDARKGLAMFEKVDVPILGLVENMGMFCCPNCGTETPIFATGGVQATAQNLQADFLGQVPLDLAIREASDTGTPYALTHKDSIYHTMAQQIWQKLES